MTMRDILIGVKTALNGVVLEIGGTPISIATILTFVSILVITVWISRIAQRALIAASKRRSIGDNGTVAAFQRLLHYVILIFGFSVALTTIGIDLGTLFAAGAIFAVGVGFAMQTLAQNFVAGVILLMERTIRVDDVLEVEGQIVVVRDIGIRSTVVESPEGEELIVPNSSLVQNTVTNHTMTNAQLRLTVDVGVHYDSDMELVENTLLHAAESFHGRMPHRPPEVLLKSFGDSAVVWGVLVWIDEPWLRRKLYSELHKAIWAALKAADICIPYPQLDVHVPTHKSVSP